MSNGVVCNGSAIKDNSLPVSNEPVKVEQKPKITSFSVTDLQKSPSDQSVTSQNYSNILKSVGKKIRKTKAELDRSGWIHGFYILGLVIYSVIGGYLFLFLDGQHSDMAIANYDQRCVEKRETLWHQLVLVCANLSFDECQISTRMVLLKVDDCLRKIDRNVTVYSTSSYLISLIYAITVYTTIGYGTISMSSRAGRAATIVYTIIGTPLFFAFLNDMGQWFQRLFLLVYVKLRRLIKNTTLYKNFSKRQVSSALEMLKYHEEGPSKTGLIFTCSVIFLILYFLMVSTLFSLIEEWNYFDSFYFVFQSIALIGFGDVFPEHPSTVLFTIIFIIVGISLLSMCFFILQEWIREKTSKLSKRFRYSVRHWRESVHFSTYSISNIYKSSRAASRRESTFVADQIPGVNCNYFPTQSSNSASREHSPQLPKSQSLNWDRKMLKMNSMGKAVAAGRFQFVTDNEHNSDESD